MPDSDTPTVRTQEDKPHLLEIKRRDEPLQCDYTISLRFDSGEEDEITERVAKIERELRRQLQQNQGDPRES